MKSLGFNEHYTNTGQTITTATTTATGITSTYTVDSGSGYVVPIDFEHLIKM